MYSNKIKCIKDHEIFKTGYIYEVECNENNKDTIYLVYYHNYYEYVLATINPTKEFKDFRKNKDGDFKGSDGIMWHDQDWYQDAKFKEHFQIIWFEEEE
jgi:hypothetical protein